MSPWTVEKSAQGGEEKGGMRKGNEGRTEWESAVPGEVERKLRGRRRKLESFWNGG